MRYRYREYADLRSQELAYAVAIASLYSHPAIDPKGAARTVNSRFSLAKGYIPYYNVMTQSAKAETENAVRLLRILNKNVTKEIMEAEDRRQAERRQGEWATSSNS